MRAARESMVLLKNDANFLPLKRDGAQTIAVIGPLAASLIGLEGNYNAIPLKPILPIDGIATEFGGNRVLYAEGSPYIMGGSVPVPRTLFRTAGNSSTEGLTAEYFPAASFAGTPELTQVDKQIEFDWSAANPVPSLSADTTAASFAVRWTGTIAAPEADQDNFDFRLPFCYPCGGNVSLAVFIDGKPLEPLTATTSAAGHRPCLRVAETSVAFSISPCRFTTTNRTRFGLNTFRNPKSTAVSLLNGAPATNFCRPKQLLWQRRRMWLLPSSASHRA